MKTYLIGRSLDHLVGEEEVIKRFLSISSLADFTENSPFPFNVQDQRSLEEDKATLLDLGRLVVAIQDNVGAKRMEEIGVEIVYDAHRSFTLPVGHGQVLGLTFGDSDTNGGCKICKEEWKEFSLRYPRFLKNTNVPDVDDIVVDSITGDVAANDLDTVFAGSTLEQEVSKEVKMKQ
ncbi:hypothetical protein Tco_1175168 [Tanacetum coccineum]